MIHVVWRASIRSYGEFPYEAMETFHTLVWRVSIRTYGDVPYERMEYLICLERDKRRLVTGEYTVECIGTRLLQQDGAGRVLCGDAQSVVAARYIRRDYQRNLRRLVY